MSSEKVPTLHDLAADIAARFTPEPDSRTNREMVLETLLRPVFNELGALRLEVAQLRRDKEKLVRMPAVYCKVCGGYLAGHATGNTDLCTCFRYK